MKKVLSFIIAAVLVLTLCGACLARADFDPTADANAKFAALSDEEKDKLYDLTDVAAIDIIALLKAYAEAGIISSTTYEHISENIKNTISEAKEASRLPGLMPPRDR